MIVQEPDRNWPPPLPALDGRYRRAVKAGQALPGAVPGAVGSGNAAAKAPVLGGGTLAERAAPQSGLLDRRRHVGLVEAGIVEVPNARIFPLRARSVSADSVSSISVPGSGRWI
jgi:hypothetical protein